MKNIFPIFTLMLISFASNASTFLSFDSKPLTSELIEKLSKDSVNGLIYSGDLIFDLKELEMFGFSTNLWPDGRLVFEFSSSLSPGQKSSFLSACNAWASASPVTCVERTVEPDYVFVISHNGEKCGGQVSVSCSHVGKKWTGGAQELAIYTTHWDVQSVIRHEIGHAFGLIHEQSRPDRDSYVFIHFENISSNAHHNFTKQNVSVFTDYDYQSIMHYHNCAFTIHPQCATTTPQYQSIVPKPCHIDIVGGNLITQLDLEGMSAAYAPKIYSLVKPERRPLCGVHNLSREQKNEMCGNECGAVGETVFDKIEENYNKTCGFRAGIKDYQKWCQKHYSKDFVKVWFDKDCPHIECVTGCLLERWIQCGCANQAVNASCIRYSTNFNSGSIDKQIKGGELKNRLAARYIKMIEEWDSQAPNKQDNVDIDKNIISEMIVLLLMNYNRIDFEENINSLYCNTKRYVAIKSYIKRRYTFTIEDFKRLAVDSGFVIANI